MDPYVVPVRVGAIIYHLEFFHKSFLRCDMFCVSMPHERIPDYFHIISSITLREGSSFLQESMQDLDRKVASPSKQDYVTSGDILKESDY
jgi:hypothetical protein